MPAALRTTANTAIIGYDPFGNVTPMSSVESLKHTPPERGKNSTSYLISAKVWIASGRSQWWRLTNGTDGGDGRLGSIVTEETRAKLSAAGMGRPGSMLGRHHTDEAKAKVSAAMTGRVFTDEWRAKISEAKTGLSPELTEEERQRRRDAATGNTNRLGKPFTPEAIEKIKAKRNAYEFTDEHRASISNALKGRVFTDEWRANLSAAAKQREERKRLKKSE